ncbi:MAG: nucleotidyltransferase family protein [Bacteroidales bacterium]|nr:nucleotidyltransferase family protein [Bacteroidales bacterium]
MKLGCVLMASGNSERFGENKLSVPFDGKLVYQRALDAIPADRFYAVAVVTQYKEIISAASKRGFIAVPNLKPDDGVSRTIWLGIQTLYDASAIMFMVADQPLLRQETVRQLADDFVSQSENMLALAANGRRGNPVIFPSCYFDELCALKGDSGGGAVIKKHESELRLHIINDESELADIDSKQELEKLLKKRE